MVIGVEVRGGLKSVTFLLSGNVLLFNAEKQGG